MMRQLVVLIACVLASPALADEPQITAFTEACLGSAITHDQVAAVAATFGADLPDTDPPASILSPLVVPQTKEAWFSGDPGHRATGDLAFGFSEGSVFDAPATGCAVLFYADAAKPLIAAVLAGFDSRRFITLTEDGLLLGSRYWLVEHNGEQAVFSVSQQAGQEDLPTVLRLAFERLDASVIDLVLGGP